MGQGGGRESEKKIVQNFSNFQNDTENICVQNEDDLISFSVMTDRRKG